MAGFAGGKNGGYGVNRSGPRGSTLATSLASVVHYFSAIKSSLSRRQICATKQLLLIDTK
jgi:hypothetical protein